MSFIIKATKAALLFAAFVFLHQPYAVAVSKTETYKDLIKKSQALVLQKDRPQGLSVLAEGIKKEPLKSAARKELIRAAYRIGTLFLTEDGQQIYELARSLREVDISQAIEKLKEAQRLELGSLTINVDLARLYLRQNECSKAKKIIEQISQLFPAQMEIAILALQHDRCTSTLTETSLPAFEQEFGMDKSSPYWPMLQSFELERIIKLKQRADLDAKRAEFLKAIQGTAYAESHYWLYQLELLSPAHNSENAQKYLQLCKIKDNSNIYLHIDPWYCSRVEEVSKLLEKNEAD